MRILFSLCLLVSVFLSVPIHAQSGSFGTSVVLEQDELFVGEPNTTFREGSVYVYQKTGEGWSLDQRLVAPNAARADGFGSVLAKSGMTLFVGQRNGPLHVFERDESGWNPHGILDGNGTKGIDPGCSGYGYCGTNFGVTLAAEGEWLLVGAPGIAPPTARGESEPDKVPGAVYVYRQNGIGNWTEYARLALSDGTPGDQFGSVIHLSNGRALIGAPSWDDKSAGLEGVGRATQFDFTDGKWTEMGSLPFFSESTAAFGSSFAMKGDEILVGAPGSKGSRGAVFAYAKTQNGWMPKNTLSLSDGQTGDLYGSGIAYSGNEIWIGVPTLRENLTGSTLVY